MIFVVLAGADLGIVKSKNVFCRIIRPCPTHVFHAHARKANPTSPVVGAAAFWRKSCVGSAPQEVAQNGRDANLRPPFSLREGGKIPRKRSKHNTVGRQRAPGSSSSILGVRANVFDKCYCARRLRRVAVSQCPPSKTAPEPGKNERLRVNLSAHALAKN